MRFLADENFPRSAIVRLQAAGHDVVWVRTHAPGAADAAVLAQAEREQRLLLTFDKDFGELARSRLPHNCGILLFRLSPKSDSAAGGLVDLILARNDWMGHFSVIEPGRIRMRLLGS